MSIEEESCTPNTTTIKVSSAQDRPQSLPDVLRRLGESGIVESFITDATSAGFDRCAGTVQRFDDLDITLLVNKVNETHLESRTQGAIVIYTRITMRSEKRSGDDHPSVVSASTARSPRKFPPHVSPSPPPLSNGYLPACALMKSLSLAGPTSGLCTTSISNLSSR